MRTLKCEKEIQVDLCSNKINMLEQENKQLVEKLQESECQVINTSSQQTQMIQEKNKIKTQLIELQKQYLKLENDFIQGKLKWSEIDMKYTESLVQNENLNRHNDLLKQQSSVNKEFTQNLQKDLLNSRQKLGEIMNLAYETGGDIAGILHELITSPSPIQI